VNQYEVLKASYSPYNTAAELEQYWFKRLKMKTEKTDYINKKREKKIKNFSKMAENIGNIHQLLLERIGYPLGNGGIPTETTRGSNSRYQL